MKTVTIRELHAKTGELVRAARRHGQIFVTDNGRTVARILPENEETPIPYFARRKVSAGFSRLDKSGKTGQGTEISRLISEDRQDRL